MARADERLRAIAQQRYATFVLSRLWRLTNDADSQGGAMPSVRPSEYNQRGRETSWPIPILLLEVAPPHPDSNDDEPDHVDVFFSLLEDPESDSSEPLFKILSVYPDALRIFLVETRADHAGFGKPKHDKLREIMIGSFREPFELPENQDDVEHLLSRLPRGLAKDFRFGLGFLWEYRQIVEAVEEFPHVDLLIITGGDGVEISPSGRMVTLGITRLERLRKSIDRTVARFRTDALRDKRHLVYHELLHVADPSIFPEKRKKLRKDMISDLTRGGADLTDVSPRDRSVAMKLVRDGAQSLAKSEPRALMALKADIELASLSELIDRFDSMLGKSLDESHWQQFFEDNPFILSLAFAVPVFYLQGNAYVGGKRLDGTGGKFADFVYATVRTGNISLIEIKKPKTDLLTGRPYRGSEVFGPSAELGGAVAQLLDQRQKLVQELPNIRMNSNRNDIYAHSVRGVIVAGLLPESIHQRRSFELFRGGIGQLELVTFDELRARMLALKHALSSSRDPALSASPFAASERTISEIDEGIDIPF